MRRIRSLAAVLALAGVALASDEKLLVLGPVPGGQVTLGFHDDWLLIERCGSTCTAPPLCQVTVSCAPGDSPAAAAAAFAAAINADPGCQGAGFSATASADAAGNGVLTIATPPGVEPNVCVDLGWLADRFGCCPGPLPTPCGQLVCLSSVYCAPKPSGQGCVPLVSAAGDAGVSDPAPYLVQAAPAPNARNGVLVYGTAGGWGAPFLGGQLCLRPPLSFTPVQLTGGAPPPVDDCSGSLTFDFNAWVQSGADPLLAAGQTVSAQYWIRDPGHPDGTGAALSDAVGFLIGP